MPDLMLLEGATTLIIWFLSVRLPTAKWHQKSTIKGRDAGVKPARAPNGEPSVAVSRFKKGRRCSGGRGFPLAQSTKWPLALAGPREDPIQDGGAAVAETGSDSRMMPNGLMDVDTTGGSGGGVCGKRRVLVHIQGFGAQMLLSQSFFFPWK